MYMNNINLFPLLAAETSAEEAGGMARMLMSILPFLLLIPIFYFLMYRPQKKQEKETAQMRNNLMIGDEVSTIGGIMGRIVKVKEDYVIIETGSDRTKLKMRKTAIGAVEKKAGDEGQKKPSTFKVSAGKSSSEKSDDKNEKSE